MLSFVPGLSRLLPRPGRWMETLKQFFAFPMFLTAALLLWTLGAVSGPAAVAWTVAGGTLIAFGIWLTNAHPTDGSNRTELDASAERSSAVFTHNARLNHSCSPVRRPAAQTLDCSNRIAPSCAGPEVHGRANGRDPPTGPTLVAESALQLERGAWRNPRNP